MMDIHHLVASTILDVLRIWRLEIVAIVVPIFLRAKVRHPNYTYFETIQKPSEEGIPFAVQKDLL